MEYRRILQDGGTYFFTWALERRDQTLLTDHVSLLRQAFRYTHQRHPFRIDAVVILPEHLHTVWTLPPGDSDFSNRIALIKKFFSRNLVREEPVSASRQRKQERGIWQRRFWEHLIRDEDDFRSHIDYVHFNPVKHGFVQRASEWPYSSIHRYIRQGILSPDWAV